MGELRTRFSEQSSTKKYPDPKDPKVAKAIEKGRKEFEEKYLGKTFPWSLGGASFMLPDCPHYTTCNPFDRSVKVGMFPIITRAMLPENAIENIQEAGLRFFNTVPPKRRVQLLCEISKVVSERFWLFVAAMQYETGQSLAEAVGEMDEAVDFPCANAMYFEELNEETLSPTPGSAGQYNGKRYVPHGVFLNICPFNFPVAIPLDMACKALAMGNAFIEKSSDKSSLCGYLMYECIVIAFERLKIPHAGVVNYAPGGPEVAHMLLGSPDIAGVSFTGSSQALREIKEKHGMVLRNTYGGRAALVFGSAETSGVNPIVVWSDADIEHAAKECAKSFLGRQGQKCSSVRVIMVHASVKDAFAASLEKELGAVRYGNVLYGADIGPVITPEAGERIWDTMEELFRAGVIERQFSKKVLNGGAVVKENASPGAIRALYKGREQIIAPTILYASSRVSTDEACARKLMNTEIFGPVVTIVAVSSLDDVRRLRSLSDFALTSSRFTADIGISIALAKILRTGNMYENRKCTGALVESECFGGLLSASSPSGMKGREALARFGSLQTFSGSCHASVNKKMKARYDELMEEELGVGFSKK